MPGPLMLVAMSDEPDRHIVIWQWEKEKLFKTLLLTMNPTLLRSAPSNSLMLTTSGPGILKNWFVTPDGFLKSGNFLPHPKESTENFMDHVWLPVSLGNQRMIALTDPDYVTEATGPAASNTRQQQRKHTMQ